MSAYCHPIRPIDWQVEETESWQDVHREQARIEHHLAEVFAAVLAEYSSSEEVQNRLTQQADSLRAEFSVLADEWLAATKHSSLVSQKLSHPSHLRIVGMGKPAIPLLLEALRDKPSHWFAALTATTGEDITKQSANPSEARNVWLAWGRENGYIE